MFFKITFKTGGKRLTRWATALRRKDHLYTFVIVNAGGFQDDSTINVVLLGADDIITVHPARMNLKYAELEVIPTTPKQREALMWAVGSTEDKPASMPGALTKQAAQLVDLGVFCYRFDHRRDSEAVFWVRGQGEAAMTYDYTVCFVYPIDSNRYSRRTGKTAPVMLILRYSEKLNTTEWRRGVAAAMKALGLKESEVIWHLPTQVNTDYFDYAVYPKYEIK